MLVTQQRPRVLKWFHAGPLLFGDWGTSRLYVLGLAFYYTGHASPLYLAAMSVIMAAVAWAYTVVCRSFPEGGGVYTAARQISPVLAVIGATMLLCDYIVTAALSSVEAFHYLGVPKHLTVAACVAAIAGIGVINWLGAKSAGRFALLVAVAAIVASTVIGLLCLPYLGAGLSTVGASGPPGVSAWERWESLVRIVLALSGVEAVANMTGLMQQPVRRTAKRTIWPVMAEVVILNMVFCLALNAMPQVASHTTPDYHTYEVTGGVASDAVPEAVKEYRDTAMKLLATETATNVVGPGAGRVFGIVTSAVFGLLLLSATNTAIMAMVSVMYSMAQDRELPRRFTRLNYSGVPWAGLLLACVLPVFVLGFSSDVKMLGEMYAIGVVGAITINLLSCAMNRGLDLGRWERRGLWTLGSFMLVIELTIIAVKHEATVFAAIMIGAVLATRQGLRAAARRAPAPVPMPETGWLAEIERQPTELPPGRPRIMLAARGRYQAEFAVDLARRRGAILFAIFVRTLRVMDVTPGAVPRVQDDPEALESLGTVAVLARRYGVPFVPIYVASPDIAEEILDYTVTFGCDTLVMGKTRRRAFARAVEGDVIARVARNLPSQVALITRDSSPYQIEEPAPEPPRPAPAADGDAAAAPPPT
jgi:amino acid transporter/nucleotide-binding universal stress UspA family protein